MSSPIASTIPYFGIIFSKNTLITDPVVSEMAGNASGHPVNWHTITRRYLNLATQGISVKFTRHLWKGRTAQGLPPLASFLVTLLLVLARIKQPSIACLARIKRPTAAYLLRKASASPREPQWLLSWSCFNNWKARAFGIYCLLSLVNQLFPLSFAPLFFKLCQVLLVEKTVSLAAGQSLGAKGGS